jgi:hypothetical protein
MQALSPQPQVVVSRRTGVGARNDGSENAAAALAEHERMTIFSFTTQGASRR